MEIEDSLYMVWSRMLKIREKLEFMVFIAYYISLTLLRCQFLKAPYLEELLLFKWKDCAWILGQESFFPKGAGNKLIFVMTF